jgi:hypothetical protein
MFKGLFGGKKGNDGFYMAIDENEPSTPTTTVEAPAATPATPADVPAKKKGLFSFGKPKAEKTPPAAAATTVVTESTAPAATEAKAPPAKKGKTSVKKSKKEAAAAAAEPVVATPVVAAVAEEPKTVNFATDYLIAPSSISGRRLPGANMNGFLAMAKQVEKPANKKK